MRRRYRLNPLALSDLADLADFYRPRSPKYLLKLKRELARKFRVIGRSPGLGQAAPVRAAGVRQTTALGHTILFRDTPTGVEIIRVMDGRRLIDDDLFDAS